MSGLRIVLIFLLVGIATLPCHASVSVERGTETQQSRISGVVLDRNDSRIVGALITIKNAGFVRRVRSDDEGRFELELPAGNYEISVEQRGFKTYKLPSLRADAGATAQVNIHLEVEPPREPLKIRPQPSLSYHVGMAARQRLKAKVNLFEAS
jgi:hypothetical protein